MEQTKERKYFWISRAYDDGSNCDGCVHNYVDEDGIGQRYRNCAILDAETNDMDCEAYVPHTVFIERADDTTEEFNCLAVNEEHAIELWDAAGGVTKEDDFVCAEAV